MPDHMTILAPEGMLGYSIPARSMEEGLKRDTSAAVLALARSVALHVTYPGRKAIAGNLAFPFSPSDLPAGDAYEFNVHHLVTVADPLELFPVEMVEV